MLVNVYDIHGVPTGSALHVLYEVLKQRDETTSISHRRMPTWDEHVAFVSSRPYKGWWRIAVDEDFVGAAYLTKQNEIGIFVLKEHRKKGYGSEAAKIVVEMTEGPVFANINPLNKNSIKMVEGLGFLHIQNTYKLDKPEKG